MGMLPCYPVSGTALCVGKLITEYLFKEDKLKTHTSLGAINQGTHCSFFFFPPGYVTAGLSRVWSLIFFCCSVVLRWLHLIHTFIEL